MRNRNSTTPATRQEKTRLTPKESAVVTSAASEKLAFTFAIPATALARCSWCQAVVAVVILSDGEKCSVELETADPDGPRAVLSSPHVCARSWRFAAADAPGRRRTGRARMGRCGAMTTANAQANTGEILRALDLLLAPGSVAELRCPKTKRGTISGYYDYFAAMASRAAGLSGTVPTVYCTLKPVLPRLLARAVNHTRDYAAETTADADILSRRWLPLDFDPIRPAGILKTKSSCLGLKKNIRYSTPILNLCSLDEPNCLLTRNGVESNTN